METPVNPNRSKQQQAQHERLSVDFADTPRAREAKHRWDCYPELLAALKALSPYIKILADGGYISDDDVVQARAAIAKAESR